MKNHVKFVLLKFMLNDFIKLKTYGSAFQNVECETQVENNAYILGR